MPGTSHPALLTLLSLNRWPCNIAGLLRFQLCRLFLVEKKMTNVPSPIKCLELSDSSDWSILVWQTEESSSQPTVLSEFFTRLCQWKGEKRESGLTWWRNSINSLLYLVKCCQKRKKKNQKSSLLLFFSNIIESFSADSKHSLHPLSVQTALWFLPDFSRQKQMLKMRRGRIRRERASAVKPWKDWLVAARSRWDPPLDGLGKLHAARTSRGPSAAGTGEGCEKFLRRDRCAVVQGRLSLMNKDALVLKSRAVAKGYRSMCLASRHLLWELLTVGWFWIRGENNFAGELF